MPRLLPLLSVLLFSLPAQAKDLRGRFGLGLYQRFGALPALSARYTLPVPEPALNIQVEGFGGLAATGGASDGLLVGGRLLYAFVVEDNMNLYAAGGATLLSAQKQQTIQVQPALCAEFFPFGLDNLGLQAEVGVDLDLGGSNGVATAGGVGIHYWF